jgi:hypothetical protein
MGMIRFYDQDCFKQRDVSGRDHRIHAMFETIDHTNTVYIEAYCKHVRLIRDKRRKVGIQFKKVQFQNGRREFDATVLAFIDLTKCE